MYKSAVAYKASVRKKKLLSVMTIGLFLSHGILLNLGIRQNNSFHCTLQDPAYLATAGILLTMSALPFTFLVGLFVIAILALWRPLMLNPNPFQNCHSLFLYFISFTACTS